MSEELIGQILAGRYLVQKFLAQGGMAQVFLAEDQRLDRQVALKVIHPHLAKDDSFRVKFIREAKTAAKVSHAHLVNVYDQTTDGELLFLVMEYVPGITLRDALKKFGAIPLERALEVYLPMLEGLAAAHEAGILHRDIKPENVLLSNNGVVKLGDFGLAREINDQTQTGSLIGTVAYLAPEQVTNGQADARSDVYSAGVLLFELLTGRQPFTGEQAMHVAYQHANSEFPQPSKIQPDVPPVFDEIVLWATAKRPVDRPQNAGELLAVVSRAQQEQVAGNKPTLSQLTQILPRDLNLQPSQSTEVLSPLANTSPGSAAFGAGATVPSAGGEFNATEYLGELSEPESFENELQSLARKDKSRVARLLISSLLVAGVVGGIGWYFGSGPGAWATVPVTEGRSLDDARLALSGITEDFTIIEQHSPTIATGEVIGTNPSAGELLPKNGNLEIFVSLGPKLIQVPELAGKSQSDAEGILVSLGLLVGVIREVFDDSSVGSIISVAESGKIAEGTAVDLVSSLGPLPRVQGLSEQAAKDLLEANGLAVREVKLVFSDEFAEGLAISIRSENETVSRGDNLTLTVSKGPETVLMPKVLGETVAAAKRLLEELGLKVQVNTDQLTKDWGIVKVRSVSSAEGSRVKIGSVVIIGTQK